jgi:hypothetical protein
VVIGCRIVLAGVLAALPFLAGCGPDPAPLRAENENLKKQLAKQESVLNSLQEGGKVMQQQIDLLNRELRDAKKETERAQAEVKAASEKLESQLAQTRRLTAEVQRTAATQASQTLHVENKGGQTEDFPRPLPAVGKVVESSLAKYGYVIKVSVVTEQKAVYVTERKVSAPGSLEVSGFRNQYLVSLQTLPSKGTRVSVKADFEKIAQGNKILTASPEEAAEIERRLIADISRSLDAAGKL